ncbi:hypothetical protein [Nakamurella sp. PAMC28650]|uniref:hypothetical protein n=1 Tax=Nakamurella sp. PAMC28650 TaxID=2762325 RepID=UPI00164E3E08|nr:hypothetical protein [Nakamurella sp. PAMC28650]QNK80903.1 hypothetical protein H7F38_22875 [Nakamurella sp. PAMC28650]
MALFSKGKSSSAQLFALPPNLRSDLRRIFELAPFNACNGLLQAAENLQALRVLNEGLPADEQVFALTRCSEPARGGGYMVLTDRRLIFALQPVKGQQMIDGPPEMIAIKLGEISQYVFDSGMAAAVYGDMRIGVGLVQGGMYSEDVCKRIKAAVAQNSKYGL